MNLQEFKDALHDAGWNNPNDANGTNIKQLWIKNFPKDYVINGLMKKIDDQDIILNKVIEWLDHNGHGKDIKGHEGCFACGIHNRAQEVINS